MFIEVSRAEYRGGYSILLLFNDGTEKTINFEPLLVGEVYEPLKDVGYFKHFSVTYNTIEWPNGADFAPEYLHDYPQQC